MYKEDLPIVEDSQIAFKESLITIQRDLLHVGNKKPYHYYTLITHPAAVGILAYTEDGRLVITEEYRHPVGGFILSCAAGYLNPNESPLEGAKRELLEETGYLAEKFELLGEAYPFPGISSQKTYYVKATKAKPHAAPDLEPSEIIKTHLLTKDELIQLIHQGRAVDANVFAALFLDRPTGYSLS